MKSVLSVDVAKGKSMIMTKYFKNVSADKFYIKYSKGQDTWIH